MLMGLPPLRGLEYPVLLKKSRQMLLVLTENDTATTGVLYLFEREEGGGGWQRLNGGIPVVVGRNGLAWGMEGSPASLPRKKEGDGKSPAGVFSLGACFGFAPEKEMKDLHIPYLHLTEMTECVDDVSSRYYNRIVQKDEVENLDWHSSEKMRQIEPQYRLGVLVNYNADPVVPGNGSCIFLHIWESPGHPTSGCTAMSEQHLRKIVTWLAQKQNPILVQLTRPLYHSLKELWHLPEMGL
ncbi:MAG: hypothetical protein D6732_17180 [Methanobacteriota archaeon]|nr:MAG: hypothetical protein D6732_17180 [Euryarchaeota archaeon]